MILITQLHKLLHAYDLNFLCFLHALLMSFTNSRHELLKQFNKLTITSFGSRNPDFSFTNENESNGHNDD